MNDVGHVTALVERLLAGLVQAQIWGPGHARVRSAAIEASSLVADHCRDRHVPAVLLGTVADQIVVEGRPVLGASLFSKRLVRRIAECQAGGVELQAAASPTDVQALLRALALRGGAADMKEANEALLASGVTTIRLVPPYGAGGEGVVVPGGSATEGPLFSLHQGTVDLLQGLTIAACEGRELDIGHVRAAVEGILVGLDRDPGYLHSLAHYPEYDYFTFGHVIRVGLLAMNVAKHTTDDEGLLRRIGMAALLHDVGKARVPWEVLHKRGRLTPDERREMQRHPMLGAGILLSNHDSDPMSVAAAVGHHRNPDGGGYPWTCGDYEQGIVTRLVKVCDVFEALTAVRPYKAAMTPAKAYRVMLSMKGQFDEGLMRAFMRIVGLYPPGTRVSLDDGSIARVVSQTSDLERPCVEIVEKDGEELAAKDRIRHDLSAPTPGAPSRVAAALPADAAISLAE